MQVEAAELWGIENALRQDHAIGDDHGDIGVVRSKRLERLLRLPLRRRRHGNAEPPRLLLHRRYLHFHAAPGGFCRPGVDGGDLMAMGHELEQRRHRKTASPYDNQAEQHIVRVSCGRKTVYPSWPGMPAVRGTRATPPPSSRLLQISSARGRASVLTDNPRTARR